jgi:uncharacterized lipoprotein YddW (UPF0748 family)
VSVPRHALHRVHNTAAALAGLAIIASCDGDRGFPSLSNISGPPPAATRQGLDVGASRPDAILMVRTPSALAGQRGGTSVDLDAVVVNPNGRELAHKKHIEWWSSDTRVATVDSTGLVTAQDIGTVDIVVDYKKDADTVHVLVIPVPVASVTLSGPDSISLDDTVSFTATPLDSANAPLEGRIVSWSSSAPAIASVESGQVIGVGIGTTEITAESEGKSATQSLRVWPQPVASVRIAPETFSLPQFRKTVLSATAFDRRGKVLLDRAVSWSSSAPTIVAISAQGEALAKDVGQATITATVEGKSAESAAEVINPIEARALWVTRFEYTTPNTVDFAKMATIFQKAAGANFNVVYFQVRTSGDALYFSSLEPCSPRMCGTLGGPRPAQDPLDVALAEAAKYGIQVHAWVNAYTGFISGSSTACTQFINSTPMNWLKAHPEWSVSTKNFTTGVRTRQVDNCLTSSEYMWISPGVPEVRTQLARVTADIARRYGPKGLKGIHLDRIRFPSNQVSYDQPSQDAFQAATGNFPTSNAQASWLNFRRGFVNQGVREVYDSVQSVDPSLVLSAAVFPGYKPITGWAAQWSYTDLFQDPQAWAQGGYLDVEASMSYPATAASTSWTVKAYCSNTDWTCVLDDHRQRIEQQAGRQVYVGVGAIKGWTEMSKQLDIAHERLVTGIAVYSYSLVDAIPNGWSLLASGPFKNRAIIPAMGWKPQLLAEAP